MFLVAVLYWSVSKCESAKNIKKKTIFIIGTKRLERVVDHLSTSNFEVKNGRETHILSLYAFILWSGTDFYVSVAENINITYKYESWNYRQMQNTVISNIGCLNQCTVQTFTESEDIRCCVNTIFPPENGHVNARNMSRIIV